jgi:hypothetical protein
MWIRGLGIGYWRIGAVPVCQCAAVRVCGYRGFVIRSPLWFPRDRFGTASFPRGKLGDDEWRVVAGGRVRWAETTAN